MITRDKSYVYEDDPDGCHRDEIFMHFSLCVFGRVAIGRCSSVGVVPRHVGALMDLGRHGAEF